MLKRVAASSGLASDEYHQFPLGELQGRLRALGVDRIVAGDQQLVIPALSSSGFDVAIHADGDGGVIRVGEIEHHVASTFEALNWAERLLSTTCRLRVDYIGKRPWCWTLELWQPCGAWSEALSAGHVRIWPFGRTKRSEFFVNCSVSKSLQRRSAVAMSLAAALVVGCLAICQLPSSATAASLEQNGEEMVTQAATRRAAELLVDRGIALASQGFLDQAVFELTEAVRIDPKYASGYLNRGVAISQLGRHREAVTDFTEAIRLTSRNASAFAYRGLANLRLRAFEAAKLDFDQAIAIDPNFAPAFAGRAVTYEVEGQHSLAVDDCNLAIALGLADADVYATRAVARDALGRHDEAQHDLSEVYRLRTAARAGQPSPIDLTRR